MSPPPSSSAAHIEEHPVCRAYPLATEILTSYAHALGPDFCAYQNHVTRVLNFWFTLRPALHESGDRCIIAAAFHDLGIWTDRTFDYLDASCREARNYLTGHKRAAEISEVETIIQQHHKLRPYRGPFADTVESFRQADLADLSCGVIRAALPRSFVRAVRTALPNAGFHRKMCALTIHQFFRTPLRPLPMVKW